jgi:ABC-type branched-subunit amino acid transport system substrate-binding protein
MRSKFRWLTWLLVMGMLVAACGGDGASDTTAAAADEGDTGTETTAADEGDTGAETTMADEGDTGEAMDIATDFGVDLEAGTISVGLLSDLTGAFGPLVSAIVAGYQAYIDDLNANGGINGMQVVLEVRDTGYIVDNHIQFYNELKDQVVMIGHSTGSPHTVAINADLQADNMLAIPLTWYSGWSDSTINANLLSHGTPYCVEAHNTIGYIVSEVAPEATTIAVAGFPGDYGQDSVQGAKLAAEAAGLEVVYDGEGAVIPTDETTLTSVANAIADADPDIVWLVSNGTVFGAIFGQALAAGYEGIWSGASPSWSPALVAPDSPIKDAIAASFIGGTYTAGWTTEGAEAFTPLLEAAGLPVSDYYFEGIVEAKIVEAALRAAYDSGDMTRAGVLAAGKSLEAVDFGGIAPPESYVGADNDRLQRSGYIFAPDPEGLAAGTSGGRTDLEVGYTSELAANFAFSGACYTLS